MINMKIVGILGMSDMKWKIQENTWCIRVLSFDMLGLSRI